MENTQRTKEETISSYIQKKDIEKIKEFGVKHGFLDAGMRAKAYMTIFEITNDEITAAEQLLDISHKFPKNEIVENDIKRSFTNISLSRNLKPEERQKSMEDLRSIIISVTTKNPGFTYYQGFNYIGEVFLVVYGKHLGYVFTERLALSSFKEYFDDIQFEQKLHERLLFIYHVLRNHYPTTLKIFKIEDDQIDILVGKFAFMISWLLCWFSYKICEIECIYRIFDYLICSEEDALNYLTACVVGNMFEDSGMTTDSRPEDLLEFIFNYQLEGLHWENLFKKCDQIRASDSTFFGRTFNYLGNVSSSIKDAVVKSGEKRKNKLREWGKKKKTEWKSEEKGNKVSKTNIKEIVGASLAIGAGAIALMLAAGYATSSDSSKRKRRDKSGL